MLVHARVTIASIETENNDAANNQSDSSDYPEGSPETSVT